jgi:hypothetical protein
MFIDSQRQTPNVLKSDLIYRVQSNCNDGARGLAPSRAWLNIGPHRPGGLRSLAAAVRNAVGDNDPLMLLIDFAPIPIVLVRPVAVPAEMPDRFGGVAKW